MTARARSHKTKAELGLAEVFAAARPALPGGAAVAASRAAAFDRFAGAGLPHGRVEAWKYTDLRRLMPDAKPLAPAPDAAARALAVDAGKIFSGLGFRRLVVVDGAFVPELSDLAKLEPGLGIGATAAALARDEPLLAPPVDGTGAAEDLPLALNAALAGDGIAVEVAAGAAIDRPIHLAFVTTSATPTATFTRSQLLVGAHARVTVIETHEGPDQTAYQVNVALQLVAGEDARIDHIKVIREGNAALHLGTLLATVGARARLGGLAFTTGGAVIRNQMFLELAGSETVVDLRGVSLLAGKQHADTTLAIDHAAPGCQSRELFKAVVDDEARAVFQGKITVRQQAQKTDARMMTRALLLSDAAEANSKPELEIFADDVQCGHGATTGTLDDQLKFYLMARGIPDKEAEALLIQAFAAEVVEAIEHEDVREALLAATLAWLGERG
jgi:Fe-S cluster assembly protein SufD